MKNDLISVVVPCYNVEKYLEKCVKSIIDQTYQNLEIILVDDGATDTTPQLCDKLSETDPRIKVIHKPNSGVSDTRNIGLNIALGKYITFLDSDDWIERNTIETAYKEVTNKNLDLVIWGYYADFVDENENLTRTRSCKLNGICEKGRDTNILTYRNALGLSGYTWNKLYKTDIIKDNNLLFEKGVSLVEDILFNSAYFCICKKIAFIDFVGNHYIQRNRITLGTKRYENAFELRLKACAACEAILKHFDISNKTISKIMADFYYSALTSAITTIATEPDINSCNAIKKLKDFLSKKEVQNIAKKATQNSLKHRILVILMRLRAASILFEIKK